MKIKKLPINNYKTKSKTMKIARTRHFWKWFTYHHETLLLLSKLEKAEFDYWNIEMLIHIRAVCPVGVGMDIIINEDNSGAALIFTSQGAQQYFKEIETLVLESPAIEGWDFYALYPPMPADYQIDCLFKGTCIVPDNLHFNPLETKIIDDRCHLTVYTEDEVPISGQYARAVRKVLFNLLGEKSFACDLASLVIKPIEEASEETCEGFFPLDVLSEWLPESMLSPFAINKKGIIIPRYL
jgi:hypothetical protein